MIAGDFPVSFGRSLGEHSLYGGKSKRLTDLILGSATVVLTLPVCLLCAAVVRLASPGPILYTQTRIGLFGLPFQMYKFRTMRVDAEATSGAVWAAEDDPRVIPACKWMRRSHLDELPQLINVLRGQMSLVGPRPERLEIMLNIEVEDRVKIVKRLDFKPGITGLAQIRSGYNTDQASFTRKLNYDMEYIDNHSFWGDLKIMALTLPKLWDSTAH